MQRYGPEWFFEYSFYTPLSTFLRSLSGSPFFMNSIVFIRKRGGGSGGGTRGAAAQNFEARPPKILRCAAQNFEARPLQKSSARGPAPKLKLRLIIIEQTMISLTKYQSSKIGAMLEVIANCVEVVSVRDTESGIEYRQRANQWGGDLSADEKIANAMLTCPNANFMTESNQLVALPTILS